MQQEKHIMTTCDDNLYIADLEASFKDSRRGK